MAAVRGRPRQPMTIPTRGSLVLATLAGVVACFMCPGRATAQLPGFHRGDGQLLPPALRGPDDPDVDMADLTAPEYLWAFHREALLVPSASPALPADAQRTVVAALTAATGAADATLRWQSLWALARIGRGDAAVAGQARDRVLGGALLAADGTVGDVACVALGIAARGDAKALGALAGLATAAGGVPRRRAFAFYGLGLAAQETPSPVVQFRVLAAVERALLAASQAPDEVRIAALHALALTRLDAAPDLPGPALQLLEQVWAETPPQSPAALAFRAHVPAAVAAMLTPDDAAAEVWRERFAAVVQQPTAPLPLVRSAVLALGALCRPWRDDGSPDADYGKLLQRSANEARDVQTRNYAWFAIGLAGGERHRAFLLDGLAAGILVRPWAAFGLAAAAAKGDAADAGIIAALEQAVAATKHPSVRAALAGALAVARREPVRDPAVRYLERYREPLPGNGAPAARAAALAAELGHASTPIERCCTIAMALGHLGDPSPRHWSARLARAIDYRSATPALLGRPSGVFILP